MENKSLENELELVDYDIAEFYKKQNGNYIKGTPLLAQLVRELKILNSNHKPFNKCFYAAGNDTSGRCIHCGKQKFDH